MNELNTFYKGYFTAVGTMAVLFLFFSCLGGCVTTADLTDEERMERIEKLVRTMEIRQWNHQVDANNWMTCRLMLRKSGIIYITTSVGRIRSASARHFAIRNNLRLNHCYIIVPCKYWETYFEAEPRLCRDIA